MLRKRYIVGSVIILLFIGGMVAIVDYFGIGKRNTPLLPSGASLPVIPTTEKPQDSRSSVPYRLETVVEGLSVPWSIVFTSPTRILVTERSGRVRAIVDGRLQSTPLLTLSGVSDSSEEGLMGMALHPEYSSNKAIYLAYAYQKGSELAVRVERYIDEDNRLTQSKTIIESIPAAQFHAGTRIKFGPDRKLYITTGDATNKQIAQQKDSLGGKILRLNDDGTIPSDNPFPGSAVYSLGHRNPQGIDWHPVAGTLYETEHGPSVFDGPAGGDEVNVIKAGLNYGWPIVSHEKNQEGFIAPVIVYTPAVAPASGMFYSGKMFPQFKHNFFFGGLKGEGIYRVIVDESNPERVIGYTKIEDIRVGRVREVAEGPDGALYFSTSNKDGRGNPTEGDDRIMKLTAAP